MHAHTYRNAVGIEEGALTPDTARARLQPSNKLQTPGQGRGQVVDVNTSSATASMSLGQFGTRSHSQLLEAVGGRHRGACSGAGVLSALSIICVLYVKALFQGSSRAVAMASPGQPWAEKLQRRRQRDGELGVSGGVLGVPRKAVGEPGATSPVC